MANKNYISGSLVQTPPTFTAVTTGSDEYSVEFNDANASGLYWQGSRYLGNQLFTTEINKVTSSFITGSGSIAGVKYIGPISNGITGSLLVPDKTGYGNSSCVQKYTRNIYLGNSIIGMDSDGVSEDKSLLHFPKFSYAQTNTYFTINSDDTIEVNRLESTKNNFDSRIGFYRKFYEDFPVNTSCKIVINDSSIKTSLKDSYPIFFNDGKLQKIINFQIGGNNGATIRYTTSSNILQFVGFGNELGSAFNITASLYNENLIQDFFTGSLDDFRVTVGNSVGTFNYFLHEQFHVDFLSSYFSYRNNSDYVGDKRMFATFTSKSINSRDFSAGNPINTNIKYNIPPQSSATPFITNNAAQLSTIELIELDNTFHFDTPTTFLTSTFITASQKFTLNQNYQFIDSYVDTVYTYSDTGNDPTPLNFASGSLTLSLCNNSNPCVLIPLDKNSHLPDGIGKNGFIILPENIHPHIKQNLTYYLAKAGIPLGVDTIPVLNNEFKKLK